MSLRLEELEELATENILGVKILDKKKFAALIIRECCDIMSYWADGLIEDKHHEFLAQRIKHHFKIKDES